MKKHLGTMLVAVAVLSGCGQAPSADVDLSKVVAGPVDSDRAVEILSSFYGLTTPPAVYWYGGAALDCHDGHAFTADGWCVQGITYRNSETVLSDYWPTQSGLVGDGALQHEMAHVASWQHGEGGDPNHTGHYFAPGGELDQAYDLLVSMGMATPDL